jgi:hypothetical protein
VQIVTSPPPDRRLISAAIRHKSKAALWVVRGLGIALVLVAGVDLIGDPASGAFGVLVGLLLIFGVPPLLVSRAVTRCWRLFGTPGTFVIGDAGVERADALTRHGYAWPAFTGVEVLPGQLIFALGKTAFLPMSTAALLPGQQQHVLGLATHYGVPVRGV